MLCPFCGHGDTKVIDSRESREGIRRRRECLRCGLRFTTMELVQSRALMIVKSDGRREEFNRDKLWSSLTKACAKRPLPIGTLEKVIAEIESVLADTGKSEIPARALGELVMERLKELDRVAYIRFASVYRDFRDIETFKEEIEALLQPRTEPTVPDNQLPLMEEDKPLLPKRKRRGRKPLSPPGRPKS
ncbi:MAG: transcriptional regulator NrdR [Chloroflexi bacterium]|nr:transcriptional regulator NrdR [Chloroflexota bacterium]